MIETQTITRRRKNMQIINKRYYHYPINTHIELTSFVGSVYNERKGGSWWMPLHNKLGGTEQKKISSIFKIDHIIRIYVDNERQEKDSLLRWHTWDVGMCKGMCRHSTLHQIRQTNATNNKKIQQKHSYSSTSNSKNNNINITNWNTVSWHKT